MKKNWIKIGLVFVLAIGILCIGIVMKLNQGYIMDSDEDMILSMADYLNKSKDEIKLLNNYKYQKDDMSIIIIMAKLNDEYALCMFEQTQSHKYKGYYYTFSATNIDNLIMTFKDERHDVYILATCNPSNKFKKLHVMTNDNSIKPEILSDDEEYIIRCYDNQYKQISGVYPSDEFDNAIGRLTTSEDTIR